MRIDAHQHFWSLDRGDYGWLNPSLGPIYRDFSPSDLLALLKTARIDGTILVQAAPTVNETEYLLSIANSYDWVLGVVGWVDMDSDDCLQNLEKLSANKKLCGIRPMIHDIDDEKWMLRPGLDKVFNKLIELNLTFDALVRPVHLKHLRELLRRYPQLACVIDHGAKPEIRENKFDDWADDMLALANETSALCKLSGLATESPPNWTAQTLEPYVKHILGAFGAKRAMFGSDWPVLLLAGDYQGWVDVAEELTASLSKDEKDFLFGKTAAKFYLDRR